MSACSRRPSRSTSSPADAPQTAFVGRYTLTVDLPAFDFELGAPNPEVTIPMVNTFEATASTSGSTVVLELDEELTWTTEAIMDGTSFEIPAMPIARRELVGARLRRSQGWRRISMPMGSSITPPAVRGQRPRFPHRGCRVGHRA